MSTTAPTPTRLGKAAANNRVSQGAGQLINSKGGLGYIARRGVDFGSSMAVQTMEGLARLSMQQPLVLLSLLPDVVPEVSMALWNMAHLGCGKERVRLKATLPTANGGNEEDPAATALINELWENNPQEVGGFRDALEQNLQMLCFSGMAACEAVPSGRGKGLAAIYPVNTLTLRYKRETDGELTLYQQQIANANGLALYSGGMGGVFVPMPMNRFFYARLSALPDEPYGRAPFGVALTPVMEALAFWRDLLLAWHRVGTPKWDIGFDFEMWSALAKDIVGLTDPVEIQEYVQNRYNDAIQFYSDLNADDAFFHDIKSTVNAVGAGAGEWPDIEGLWNMLRSRLIQALKQLPTLMGIVEGSTETWSTVEWDIYTAGLQNMVEKAAAPLVGACQLHLRLLGMPHVAECDFAPAASITRLRDAQSMEIEISNHARMRDEGWESQETAAMEITGSAPVADPRSWTVQNPAVTETIAEDE